MQHSARSAEEQLGRALIKLMECVEEKEGAFDASQRRQVAVWKLQVIMVQQLLSDDSFVYNKACKNVRELIEALPESDDAEEVAFVRIQVWIPS
jgi:hypothetical protein